MSLTKVIVRTFDFSTREIIVPYSDSDQIALWLKKFYPITGLLLRKEDV